LTRVNKFVIFVFGEGDVNPHFKRVLTFNNFAAIKIVQNKKILVLTARVFTSKKPCFIEIIAT
jgi:hypothetical protein